jgi:thioredoxin reductase
VERGPDGSFTVSTDQSAYRTLRVVLAIGRRGLPRKLGVPGEEAPNVSYALLEPESYRGDRVLVVGGGDSAVEAALALSGEPGTDVRLSYRRDNFSRIKEGNRTRLETAESEDRIRVHRATEVDMIGRSEVVLRGDFGTEPIPNDQVFIFAGGELPTRFLSECGVVVDTKFGEP